MSFFSEYRSAPAWREQRCGTTRATCCRALVAALAGVAILIGLTARPALARPAAAVRVVSQTVGGDEMLLALAKPEQVAALSHLARDPEFSAVAREAEKFPTITLGDAESILRFAPTLVLFADYSRAELVAHVRRAGVQVMVFDHYETLEDAYANLRRLAAALGAEEKCEALIRRCQARVRTLEERLSGVKPVRVIAPSSYGLIAGAKTTFQDLCDHAGAENVAATVGGLVGHQPTPSERLLTWPVEMVVVAGDNLEEALGPFREMPPFAFMPAVKEGRAVLIRSYMLSSVTHYRIDGYEALARGLHPELFP